MFLLIYTKLCDIYSLILCTVPPLLSGPLGALDPFPDDRGSGYRESVMAAYKEEDGHQRDGFMFCTRLAECKTP